MKDLVYDIETFPNLLSICFYNPRRDVIRFFEMSDWRNDWKDFHRFVHNCGNGFIRWVGFNNFYFDYQVIHHLVNNFRSSETDGRKIARIAHEKAMRIIRSGKDERFKDVVWENNHLVPQVDLFRIHHFDNVSRATSLKVLEFNMRSETIEDLPLDPLVPVTDEQRSVLLGYNEHDVRQTFRFYEKTLPMIRFREELGKKYNRSFINFNDTKIGKEYFIMELEKEGVTCFRFRDGEREPVQTKRDRIVVKDIIFPYIRFEKPEFNAVLSWLRKQTITRTKGVFTGIDGLGELEKHANLKTVKGKIKNLNCIVDGFQFDFGTGGLHGSVNSAMIEEDSHHAILDFDVTSLYPSIAIENNVYPKHLGKKFCAIYARMKQDRISYKKGTPENAMLKLALNGVYGDSNNPFSPFYDPQYTMSITINGQLMLCMLAEKYMKTEGLKILQVNTDGITIRVPRDRIPEVEAINAEWMKITRLTLERAGYKKLCIRDVNNYLGVQLNGKIKAKGAYEFETLYREDHPDPDSIAWHRNHSAMVVPMAATANLIRGDDIRSYVSLCTDTYAFMLRTKVPRGSRLMWGSEKVPNIIRYYLSANGRQLTKIMPPLRKNREKERLIRIHDGWNVIPVNTMRPVDDINYEWYVNEAEKLVRPFYQKMLDEMCG